MDLGLDLSIVNINLYDDGSDEDPSGNKFLLLENNSFMLLESGDKILLQR